MSFRSVAAKHGVVRMAWGMTLAWAAPLTVSLTNESFVRAQSPVKSALFGQTAAKQPAFEVASIKLSQPEGRGWGATRAPGGTLNMTRMSLHDLMTFAYDVRDHQISGGPSWVNSERYDVIAKPGGDATNEQLRDMLQTLLTERFQLKFHRETRELRVYSLLVEKNRFKLKESSGGGPRIGIGNRGAISAEGASMKMLADALSRQLGYSVLDHTGIEGSFDFKLTWTPDENDLRALEDREGRRENSPATDFSGPSIFAALQEQLGLKLEAQKGPVEVLVIDRAERASAN